MKLILFLFLLSLPAHAFKLVEVKAVSSSQTTFITRVGKKDGIFVGKKATFTTNDAAVIAKAKTVSREFTQWELSNEAVKVPFETGDIVTYNEATEYLWTLNPGKTRMEYLKKYYYVDKTSFMFRTSLAKNLSSSVSNASTNSEIARGGFNFEGHYEQTLSHRWRLAYGARYDKEYINVSGAQLETYRMIAMIGLNYYFESIFFVKEGKPFINLSVGYGLSGTQLPSLSQRGVVALLPSMRFGMEYNLNELFDLSVEVGAESLSTRESGGGIPDTKTDQLNGTFSLGIRRYF